MAEHKATPGGKKQTRQNQKHKTDEDNEKYEKEGKQVSELLQARKNIVKRRFFVVSQQIDDQEKISTQKRPGQYSHGKDGQQLGNQTSKDKDNRFFLDDAVSIRKICLEIHGLRIGHYRNMG
jgi:hypothetical protein